MNASPIQCFVAQVYFVENVISRILDGRHFVSFGIRVVLIQMLVC